MGIMVNKLAERIDTDKYAGTDPDLMQCDISKEFHDAILSEGDTWEERKQYLLSLKMEIKEAVDKRNPGETQDTSDVRTIHHSHQSDMDIQEDTEGTGRGDG